MFVEQIMIFALGFLIAGLLTLLFLPAFWRRAMTLSRRRLEMQMPLSMAEIVAERDQLRAEFAAEQRRLEQRLEAAELARGEAKRSLGERLIQYVALNDEMSEVRADAGTTTRALETAMRRINAVEAEIGATSKVLFDTETALENSGARAAQLTRSLGALSQQSDEQRMVIAGLETRLASHEADLETLERNLTKANLEGTEARAARDAIAAERDQFRSDARNAQARREALQLEYEAQGRRITDLQDEIRNLEREKSRLAAEIAEKQQTIEEERKRIREREVRISAHNDAIAAIEAKGAEAAELARAGKAAVEGALEAQRRETENARAEIVALREELRKISARTSVTRAAQPAGENVVNLASGNDFISLRKAIVDLGRTIADATAEQREDRKAANPDSSSSEQTRNTAAE